VNERIKSTYLLRNPDATVEELSREARRFSPNEECWNLHNDIMVKHTHALALLTQRHNLHTDQLRQLLATSEARAFTLQKELTALKEEREAGEGDRTQALLDQMTEANEKLVRSLEKEREEKGRLQGEVQMLKDEAERARGSVWRKFVGKVGLGRREKACRTLE
jgi:hypothetical protein